MNRRAFLTGSGLALSSALAGCANSESQPEPKIEQIHTSDTTLIVDIAEAEYAENVVFDVERKGPTEITISKENPTATYEIGELETIGTEDQQLFHETEIDIQLYQNDESNTPVQSETWTFEPELELAEVTTAEELNYEPENHDQEATPVLEVANTGTGPTQIDEIVVFDISQEIPLARANEKTAFAHFVIAHDPFDDRLQPIDVHDEDGFFVPGGESAYFALDGLLTHTGDPPESVDSATQTFDIEVRWLFDEIRYSVVIDLKNGIIESEGEEQYRFRDYEIIDVDYASPLK